MLFLNGQILISQVLITYYDTNIKPLKITYYDTNIKPLYINIYYTRRYQ